MIKLFEEYIAEANKNSEYDDKIKSIIELLYDVTQKEYGTNGLKKLINKVKSPMGDLAYYAHMASPETFFEETIKFRKSPLDDKTTWIEIPEEIAKKYLKTDKIELTLKDMVDNYDDLVKKLKK